ncbi:hypothetical protein MSAN_00241100 [Mycena sanguinolenta]|uniref:F-box domain-containing protein n=1 Tax=Mycena sanguinolenta TaxID=230812 RepID=A0A8H6ZJP8_9AGAR|nr:hypothetical protein MSAN_00241100 [Mycena sanguinolenta]
MVSSENPVLPLELERETFELAAFLYPECMLTLVLVAQRVRTWIHPMLFRTFSIHDGTRTGFSRLSLSTVAKLVKFDPLALDYTRNVCFNNVNIPGVAADFIYRCDRIVNLAFIGRIEIQYPEIILEDHPLERLCFSLTTFKNLFPFPDPFDGGHALFSCLTHLDIMDYRIDGWLTWSGLAQMPRLTHLSSIYASMTAPIVQGILKHCKRLEVLVFMYDSQARLEGAQAALQLTDDPRFVMLVVEDRLADWEAGTRGRRRPLGRG